MRHSSSRGARDQRYATVSGISRFYWTLSVHLAVFAASGWGSISRLISLDERGEEARLAHLPGHTQADQSGTSSFAFGRT